MTGFRDRFAAARCARLAAALAMAVLGPAAGAAAQRPGSETPDPEDVPVLLPLVNPDLVSIVGLAVDRGGRDADGRVGAAVAAVGGGRTLVFGRLTRGRAWSAMKVPVAVAYLDFRRGGSAALLPGERNDIEAAIVRSDNEAAKALFERMPSARARVQAVLVRAGDFRTRVASEPGTTQWRLADGLEFYRRLAAGCLLGTRDTTYLLGLMGRVVEEQRWGVPRAIGRGVPVAFKGGWGADGSDHYLVEQFAVVGRGPGSYVVGAMARPNVPATFAGDARAYQAGTELVERAARLVKRTGARLAAAARGPRCGPPRGPRPNTLTPLARLEETTD